MNFGKSPQRLEWNRFFNKISNFRIGLGILLDSEDSFGLILLHLEAVAFIQVTETPKCVLKSRVPIGEMNKLSN